MCSRCRVVWQSLAHSHIPVAIHNAWWCSWCYGLVFIVKFLVSIRQTFWYTVVLYKASILKIWCLNQLVAVQSSILGLKRACLWVWTFVDDLSNFGHMLFYCIVNFFQFPGIYSYASMWGSILLCIGLMMLLPDCCFVNALGKFLATWPQ